MSGGMTTYNTDALRRGEVWASMLKEPLRDELMAEGYVNWITEFPDGDEFIIPSIGTMSAQDYVENTQVDYQPLDTGQFRFSITDYVSTGTYITKKALQDGFYMSQLESKFVPEMTRAIRERLESSILREGQPRTGNPANYQVASDPNVINGGAHRFVASTTVGGRQVLGPEDFAKAKYSLLKAHVPQRNLISLVDPATAFHLETSTQLVNVSNNPRWEGIVAEGINRDNVFIKNIYGFDVYTTDRLAMCGNDGRGDAETINGTATQDGATACLFFSADQAVLPFIGAWRQRPEVDSKFNMDYQREEHVTTARWGTKIYRPENLVSVLVDQDTVSF